MRRSTVFGAGLLVVLGLAGCSSTQDQVLGAAAKPLPAGRAAQAPKPAAAASASKANAPRAAVAAPAVAVPSKVTVETYADNICAGLAQFGVAFHDAKARRVAAMGGSPAEVRAALLGFYDALDSAFDQVVLVTQHSGVPKLARGSSVASGVVATLGSARKAGDRYRAAAQALDPGTKGSVRSAAQRIAGNTDRDVAAQMRLLSRYDSDPAVRSAFTHAPNCRVH